MRSAQQNLAPPKRTVLKSTVPKLMLLGAWLFAACGQQAADLEWDTAGTSCEDVGQVVACDCPDPLRGTRECSEDLLWSSCRCDDKVDCVEEGASFDCTCSDGESGFQRCDEDLRLTPCDCDQGGSDPVCQEGEVRSDCSEACQGSGERQCEEGHWSACRCDTAPCTETETQVCTCDDGSQGYQECNEAQWGSCTDCEGGGSGGSGESGGSGGGGSESGGSGGGGCAAPTICHTYADVMNGCYSTGVNWVSDCMDIFDICDTGGDGCGAPTPRIITCVIREGCDYSTAGCFESCY